MALQPKPLWYQGVCDSLLAKMIWWRDNYDRGVITSTRTFLHPVDGVIDKPTQRGHEIPLTQDEANHLVRIVAALKPDSTLADDLKLLAEGLTRGRRLPNKLFMVALKFWKQDTIDICNLLLEARDGVKQDMASYVKEKLKENPDSSPWN